MADVKTKLTDASVQAFLDTIPDERKRQDSQTIINMMQTVTGEEPKMWGTSIIGFGQYHLKYESGREGDWPVIAFSPRKQNLTLYISSGFNGYSELIAKLGKSSTSKACLYIKRLTEIDQDVLREIIRLSVEHTRASYPSS